MLLILLTQFNFRVLKCSFFPQIYPSTNKTDLLLSCIRSFEFFQIQNISTNLSMEVVCAPVLQYKWPWWSSDLWLIRSDQNWTTCLWDGSLGAEEQRTSQFAFYLHVSQTPITSSSISHFTLTLTTKAVEHLSPHPSSASPLNDAVDKNLLAVNKWSCSGRYITTVTLCGGKSWTWTSGHEIYHVVCVSLRARVKHSSHPNRHVTCHLPPLSQCPYLILSRFPASLFTLRLSLQMETYDPVWNEVYGMSVAQ